jgi:Chaperone of endosialidase
MSFGKDDPPTPPDPTATAGAQTASNVSTAVANAFLNATNQQTPLGTLNYDVTSTYNFTDPTTGATYNIPRFTATQALGPIQQQTQDQTEAAKYNLGVLANAQSLRLNQIFGAGFDPTSGAPSAGNPATMAWAADPTTTIGGVADPVFQFGDAGSITRDYGPSDNFLAERGRIERAMFDRLNPQLQREQQRTDQRLADQGIRYGGAAYTGAQDDYNRMVNDARLGIIERGGTEQQRLNEMAAQRAGFQNAAQQQQYQQLLGRGQFYNAAQQQLFGEYAARAQLQNQAIAQRFSMTREMVNAQNEARKNYLTEQYARRGQPFNEVTALLSGSQIQQPNFMQTPQNTIPTTDIAGLINQNFQQQFGNYQQQVGQQNQIIGGIFGAAGNIGAGLAGRGVLSDERMKKNIHRVGTVFVAEPQPVEEPARKKLPVYEYQYKGDPSGTKHVGPMAQDVEKYDPGAVSSRGGIKYIDAPRVMGSILKAA